MNRLNWVQIALSEDSARVFFIARGSFSLDKSTFKSYSMSMLNEYSVSKEI